MIRRSLLVALTIAAAFGLSGCGKGAGAVGDNDELAIIELVNTVEGLRDPRVAAKVFAPGAAPSAAQLKDLSRYSVQCAGKPTMSGAEATLRVKFVENRTGRDAAETNWSFVKDGADWKIKSAPLP